MFAIPLSGWLYSSATGVSVVYLGLVPLPDLVPKTRRLAAVLQAVHGTLNFTLFMLVCVHVGAALAASDRPPRRRALPRMLPYLSATGPEGCDEDAALRLSPRSPSC